MPDKELDVRPLRNTDKHPAIFAAYSGLPVGNSFVLVNNHDPKHLHKEFETNHAGSYDWEYLEKGPTSGGFESANSAPRHSPACWPTQLISLASRCNRALPELCGSSRLTIGIWTPMSSHWHPTMASTATAAPTLTS